MQYSTEEDMIEWAKRESEREEKERLARLKQQEQEDLELAIALSKSEISEAWSLDKIWSDVNCFVPDPEYLTYLNVNQKIHIYKKLWKG